MIVIADTSPISYLVSISEIDILPKLYGRVLVPPSVADELRHPRAPEAVRCWIAAPPAWFEVRATSLAADEDLLQADIEIGERDAILLAEELGADE
jgi:predicted nucleic acid-binding protein